MKQLPVQTLKHSQAVPMTNCDDVNCTGCGIKSSPGNFYPVLRSKGQNTKFAVALFVFLCRVIDFSVEALPIGMKFYEPVRSDL